MHSQPPGSLDRLYIEALFTSRERGGAINLLTGARRAHPTEISESGPMILEGCRQLKS